MLKWRTDLALFESNYIASLFRAQMGRLPALVRIVHNGVGEAEFEPIGHAADATDIVALGELRRVKGFDLLLEALALVNHSGGRVSATIVGEGPLDLELRRQAERLQIARQVRFVGHRPAREAFAMGRILVIASRAESLPYVVLEAAAAGMPIVATRVGGIPEIFGPASLHLIAPENVGALAAAISQALDAPAQIRRIASLIQAQVRSNFSQAAMVEGGLAAYRETLAMRKPLRFA